VSCTFLGFLHTVETGDDETEGGRPQKPQNSAGIADEWDRLAAQQEHATDLPERNRLCRRSAARISVGDRTDGVEIYSLRFSRHDA
jgi:hypothetical protein